jgi:hypothetical protein
MLDFQGLKWLATRQPVNDGEWAEFINMLMADMKEFFNFIPQKNFNACRVSMTGSAL